MQKFPEDCLEVNENRVDNLSNNLRLNEISIPTFSNFNVKLAKTNKKQL